MKQKNSNSSNSASLPNVTGRLFFDGFVKSPYAALRFIPRHCSVRKSSPHSSEGARLASGAFYEALSFGMGQ
jgi:hypothetical protein